MDFLIQRVGLVLLEPKKAWQIIKEEQTGTAEVVRDYLIYVAAVPVIGFFIGQLFFATPRMLLFPGILAAVVFYILIFIATVMAAFVINALAGEFGAVSNETAAFKLVAYSLTAPLAAGAFFILPTFSSLSVLGFYGIYIFYSGLAPLMECPEEKAGSYTVVSVFIIVILAAVTFGITQVFTCR
jgi:hypothetical protein